MATDLECRLCNIEKDIESIRVMVRRNRACLCAIASWLLSDGIPKNSELLAADMIASLHSDTWKEFNLAALRKQLEAVKRQIDLTS